MSTLQIFKIMLLVSLIMSAAPTLISANTLTQNQLNQYKPLKANEGKKLMSLTKAKLSDVHLAKPVKYFDIRQYDAQGKYKTGWSFDMAAYKKLSKREKKKIRSVRFRKSKDPFWRIYLFTGETAGFYNLHHIDMNSKVHTISSRKEVLAFLGTIDTPAEVSMLFLNYRGKIRYKKAGDIYIFRINDVSYEDYDAPGAPVCILNITHRLMSSRGEVLLRKKINEKSFSSEKECETLLRK